MINLHRDYLFQSQKYNTYRLLFYTCLVRLITDQVQGMEQYRNGATGEAGEGGWTPQPPLFFGKSVSLSEPDCLGGG